MNIAIINGSPRKGNTAAAVSALAEGATQAGHLVEIIEPDKLNISGCKGCGACQCYKGCVATDDSNFAVDKLVAADLIVFASPVYWWGVTAQMKTLIDKCYCRGAQLKGKQVGFILVGGAATDNEQYDLIRSQFACMGRYLQWTTRFNLAYSAYERNQLAATEAMDELRALGASL